MRCPAISCPDPLNRPFSASRRDAQIDEVIRDFLKNPKGLRLDRQSRRLTLSWILKKDRRLFGGSDSAVLDFVFPYLDPRHASGWKITLSRSIVLTMTGHSTIRHNVTDSYPRGEKGVKHESDIVRDVVCGMEVSRHSHEIIYLGMNFAFCSQQCKQRFLSNPHLYIGHPGHKAPGQEGRQVIKRRTLKLARPLSSAQSRDLEDSLSTMMGIKRVVSQGDRVEIIYELLQVTAEQIENKIMEVGISLGEGWADRLHRAFVHCHEEVELDSMEEFPTPFERRY